MSLAATFQYLFRKLIIDPSTDEVSGEARPSLARLLLPGVALNGLLATPIMMAQMAALQLVSGDTKVVHSVWFIWDRLYGMISKLLEVVVC